MGSTLPFEGWLITLRTGLCWHKRLDCGVTLFSVGVEMAALCSIWCPFSHRLLSQVCELPFSTTRNRCLEVLHLNAVHPSVHLGTGSPCDCWEMVENVDYKHSKASSQYCQCWNHLQTVHQFSSVVLGIIKQWLAEKLTNKWLYLKLLHLLLKETIITSYIGVKEKKNPHNFLVICFLCHLNSTLCTVLCRHNHFIHCTAAPVVLHCAAGSARPSSGCLLDNISCRKTAADFRMQRCTMRKGTNQKKLWHVSSYCL